MKKIGTLRTIRCRDGNLEWRETHMQRANILMISQKTEIY